MEDLKGVSSASSTAFGGATGLSRRGENRPLLPEAERRKSKMLMSVQADIGRGVMFTIRLSKWYLFYCTLMAIATLSLVLYMIIDIHVKGNPLTVWAVTVDGTITLIMCIETVADMVAVGKHFWETGWHVFDFGVALTSVVSWLLMLLEVMWRLTAKVGRALEPRLSNTRGNLAVIAALSTVIIHRVTGTSHTERTNVVTIHMYFRPAHM
eukprot:XP_028352388.1 uncharacterized protein LOC112062935 [Physeter catodon]